MTTCRCCGLVRRLVRLPDLSAYQAAVQNPSTAFADPELRAATVTSGRLGLPRAVAGNFAVTFQLRDGNRLWAVRCFHRDAADRARRYVAISKMLAGLHSRMLVDIAYMQTGVRVGQAWLPVTKMPWLDGQPLNRAVEARLSDPKQLAQLERRFADLVLELRTLGIAHGDLQHGNILVNRAGELSLVDYDGMFVPALRGLPASEAGDANYQHPRRTTQFDGDLDRFAAIVIVVALRALIVAPSLWHTYNTDDNLLFQRSDFADPGRSSLFRDLLSEPATRELAERLRVLCCSDYAQVPPLEEFLALEPARPASVVLIKPAEVAVLNRLFGTHRSASRGRAAGGPKRTTGGSARPPTSGGMRSWKLRRAVAQVAVAFSSDGQLVVTADADARIWVRDAATGRTSYSLHMAPQTGRIGAVAFNRRVKVIAAVVHGSSIAIWDVSDGRCIRELLLTRGAVQRVALSADARFLAAASDNGTLRCWSLSNGSLHGVDSSVGGVASLAVSTDGRWMASVSAHPGVQLRELPGGRALRSLATGGGVSRVAASGRLLAALGSGDRLAVWEVATGAVRHETEVAAGKVNGLALAPDGQRVAFVAEDGSVSVRMLDVRGRGSRSAHGPRSRTALLRPPHWLRGVLRRVATAVP
jgi:PQQ-like domain/WD domain, G-beta repeat